MPLMLASGRGLLGGWLVAHTLPLLVGHQEVAAWAAMGLGDHLRLGLATIELLGAVLFAFDATVTTGFVLLLMAFVIAAVIHIHHGQAPWWLACYAVATALLWHFSRRSATARQTTAG
jgi:hypothetical protein